MFGSATIEVILGMIFIFLLLSILCSTINEWIAGLLKLRGKTLKAGIYQLLQDNSYPTNVNWLSDAFYNHPLVQGLGNANGLPSYIPAETFSKVLINLVLRSDQNQSLETKPLREYYGKIRESVESLSKNGNRLAQVLMTLIDQAGLDETKVEEIREGWAQVKKLREKLDQLDDLKIEEVKVITETIDRLEDKLYRLEERIDETLQIAFRNVENYFDNMMDRVSGWYKRGVQIRTVALAFLVTVSLNVDSIQLVKDLANNPTLRSAVVAAANEAASANNETVNAATNNISEDNPSIEEALNAIETLNLSIGWTAESANELNDPAGLLNRILGWLVTIIAVSVGTPFWFDLLNRLTNLRLTGRKPLSTTDTAERVAREIVRRLPQTN